MSERHSIQIVRVENGWIATVNASLFEAGMSQPQPPPIWVFTSLRPMMRFLKDHGVPREQRAAVGARVPILVESKK